MSIEPAASAPSHVVIIDPVRAPETAKGIDPTIAFGAASLPMLHVLDEALEEDSAGLAKVLRVAEAQGPGISGELAAAISAEAEHMRRLTQRIEATIAWLRQGRPMPEPKTAASKVSSPA